MPCGRQRCRGRAGSGRDCEGRREQDGDDHDEQEAEERFAVLEEVAAELPAVAGRELNVGHPGADVVDDGAEQIDAERVTGNFFDVLGATLLAGRTFTPEEDQTGGNQVVLI